MTTDQTTTVLFHDQPVRLKDGTVSVLLNCQDSEDMYHAYGDYVMDDAGNCVELQAVSADDMDMLDDDELVAQLAEAGNGEVAHALVSKARSVYAAMKEIETEFDLAIEAATDGDLERTVDALSRASRLERDHGDDPATRQLAGELLEWVEEDDA